MMVYGLSENLTIRLAQPQDLPEIVAIYNSTVAGRLVTADLQPVAVADRQNWFEQHLNDAQRPLYVLAEHSGSLKGWGSFSDYYPRAAYRITAEISIYLAESARGRGLGGKLLDFMLSQAAALAIRNVIAVVFAHNVPSIRLFEQRGFQRWGCLPQVCDLQTECLADVLLLGKRLPEKA